jgi:hypothetical protein
MRERRSHGCRTAIRNLKPIPNMAVPDARDPHVGFALALQRLFKGSPGSA